MSNHKINSSLSTGTFPLALTVARSTPLLKKPSLNPTRPGKLSSILHSVIPAQNHWESGFKADQLVPLKEPPRWPEPKVATETALASVTETLKMGRAAAQSSILILLDFIWFGQPPHRVYILSGMGITGSALKSCLQCLGVDSGYLWEYRHVFHTE